MTSYAEDKSADRRVRQSAAVVSGQTPPKIPDEPTDDPTDENILKIKVIKGWSEETKSIIAFWQGYLSRDRDDPIGLREASGLKITTLSLRRGLAKYLFAEDALFRSVNSDAWNGIQRWASIHEKLSKLFVEVADYREWLFEVNEKYSQITDPIGIRNLIRQKRADTGNIVVLYAEMVDDLEPLFEEILEYL
jgi:hypothetical protein